MKEPRKEVPGNQPLDLSELLALGLKARESWTPDELEAALEEQISLPVEFEVSRLGRDEQQVLRKQAEAHGLLLKSLRDLFQHPRPPLELLVLVKDFFKANATTAHPGLPAEVARALYYVSIAVAWLRCHRRISTLSEAQLADGFGWVIEQDWIGKDLQELVRQAAFEPGEREDKPPSKS